MLDPNAVHVDTVGALEIFEDDMVFRSDNLHVVARGERIVEYEIARGVPPKNDRFAGSKVIVARACQEQNSADERSALGRRCARPRRQARQRGCTRGVLAKSIHDSRVSDMQGIQPGISAQASRPHAARRAMPPGAP